MRGGSARRRGRSRAGGREGGCGEGRVGGGSGGKRGAAALAGIAARRAGAGLVTLACPAGLNSSLEVKCTEAMTAPLADTSEGDLAAAAEIGRISGERTVRRLGTQRLTTRKAPVIFAADIASSLFGPLISAVSGSNRYRKSSSLLDHLGKPIFPDFIHIH